MPYISKADLEQARQIDLLTYLKICEPHELIPMGRDKYKLKSHDSLKLSNGKWFWWTQNIGGVSALDYLVKVKGMNIPQAVILLSEECGFFSCKEQLSGNFQKHTYTEKSLYLPQKHMDNERVKKYLLGRGISGEIIDYCICHKMLYEEKRFHNAVFLGYDGEIPKYAAIRGTNTQKRFLSEAGGSNKAFCFCLCKGNKKLNVFESAIDAISYASIVFENGNEDWTQETYLSLGGVYKNNNNKLPAALENYLNEHSETEEIVLRLDNDDVGRYASKAILSSLKGRSVKEIFCKDGKDYNEFLMLQKGLFSSDRSFRKSMDL